MAVGPDQLPDFYPIPGFRLGTASAGIKKPGRQDLVLMELAPGGSLAGVFTQNAFCAAPVVIAKAHLYEAVDTRRYLLINTGNANAGTGGQGMDDAERCCRSLAETVSVDAAAILPFSTGVIGEPLPVQKIVDALPAVASNLSESGWRDAATGILTYPPQRLDPACAAGG